LPVVVYYETSVSPSEYDAVVSRIRFHDDLPAGLLMHTAAVTDDRHMRILDVWDSREAHEHFAASRLNPAVAAIVGEAETRTGLEVHELHSLVRPLGIGHAALT
jgi:hypothetical protein